MTDVMYKRYERNKQGKKKQAYTKGTKRKQAHLLHCPVTFM